MRAHAKKLRNEHRARQLQAWQTAHLTMIDPKHFPSFEEFSGEKQRQQHREQTGEEIAANILKWATQNGLEDA